MKLTKTNRRWLKKNKKKVNILEKEGLNIDIIGVIVRYLGSTSHDKKLVCQDCKVILSLKETKKYKYQEFCDYKYCVCKHIFCMNCYMKYELECERIYQDVRRCLDDIIICIE